MTNLINAISDYIKTGLYNYTDLENRLDILFAEGKLTKEERDELLGMAADSAQASAQMDVVEKISDLERRVFALEHKEEAEPIFPVWVPGYTTKKGEIVRYDYDKDGNYDLLRYDGGRALTALSPGKIDGWHVVDENGNVLGTFYKGEFTPAN